MNKESFSTKEVADVLNRYYVSIKVDKERKVALDNYFQMVHRILNNRGGGWPLNVILMPDKRVLFTTTYMPKDRLIALLKEIATTKKEKLEKIANSIKKSIKIYQNSKIKPKKFDKSLIQKAINGYKNIFDKEYKGFGKYPKFPQASSIDNLLNIYLISGNKDALNMATQTLNAMALGGIYDQIDGAFYRYSVDRAWEIPHFEKMLYTNAELISVYVKAYKITKSPLYKKVIKETIAFFDNRFLNNGVYFSASNADSKNFEGKEEEGFYYLFEYEKLYNYLIKEGLSSKEAKDVLNYFNIQKSGNFDLKYSNPKIAKYNSKFNKYQKILKKYRKQKEFPFIDKKINLSWNALFIKAKIDASIIDKKYLKEALKSLDKLLEIFLKDGKVYHQTLLPNMATQEGFLEDYAFLANALFSAYEATFNSKYLKLFKQVTKNSVKLFYKNNKWMQSISSEFNIEATIDDGSYKSALSTTLENLLIAVLFGEDYKYLEIVDNTILKNSGLIYNYANYYPSALNIVFMRKYGAFVIKGKNFNNFNPKYPFIYRYFKNIKQYQLCGFESCYLNSNDLEAIKKKLKKIIEYNIKNFHYQTP